MAVYLSSATLGNDETLLTVGHSGELMAWFYPHKDHAQQIRECLPAVFIRDGHGGHAHWTWSDVFTRTQTYLPQTNILQTILDAPQLGLRLTLHDCVPLQGAVLLRRIEVENTGEQELFASIFHSGDWNLGGFSNGNALRFDHDHKMLLQSHREAALAIGGDAVENWSCGKAGANWGNNAKHAIENGHLYNNDLEIGDVGWAFGFDCDLQAGTSLQKTAVFALEATEGTAIAAALHAFHNADRLCEERRDADEKWLGKGSRALKKALPARKKLPEDLQVAYERSLLCLPLLCGEQGVAVAAPEFDPEFIACGGYGYFWPRDGGEYVSGLIDAGYNNFAPAMFDWCARHQDASGLWHQRYFFNGAPAPNWCLPPDMLQIDQVGAVLWAYGKYLQSTKSKPKGAHLEMVRRAADYLLSRQTERGVHGNAFDTWETFIGSFTYSNAAIHSAFRVAYEQLGDSKYLQGAQSTKAGVLGYFVRESNGHKYLVRGLDSQGEPDETVDSSSLGAIEPFGLLDLHDDEELAIAVGTLHIMRERLEVDWMGGRAIRRFEGDAYVGGVPACVNTLWMARCSLHVGARLRELGRVEEADELRERAQGYLQTVLKRATPTGLLPELMQGPEGQTFWAAPHGWAMSSFVSGVLMLARQL